MDFWKHIKLARLIILPTPSKHQPITITACFPKIPPWNRFLNVTPIIIICINCSYWWHVDTWLDTSDWRPNCMTVAWSTCHQVNDISTGNCWVYWTDIRQTTVCQLQCLRVQIEWFWFRRIIRDQLIFIGYIFNARKQL